MRKFYNDHKKYILIPLLFIVGIVFWNKVEVGSALAKRSTIGFLHIPERITKFIDKIAHHKNSNNYFESSKDHKDKDHDDRINGLSCNFTSGAIFDVTNMLPGDSEMKQVVVTNNNTFAVHAILKGTRTGPNGQEDSLLESTLDINISNGPSMVYSNKLLGFFNDSSIYGNIDLGELGPSSSNIFEIKVDFPSSAGDQYQGKSVVFDLTCERTLVSSVVINEVYYNVDKKSDSWKDRGEPEKNRKKGQDSEWVELFNPTNKDVNLKNWTLEDGSGTKFVIHSNSIIKSHGYALLSKDESVWKHWDESDGVVKIQSDEFLGDGLDNNGDHLVLRDKTGGEVDFVRWGSDDTPGFQWTEDTKDPSSDTGASIERLSPGLDNDLSSDWFSDPGHIPTP